MGMTENERAELATLASNVRDDRLRGLIFLLLEDTPHARATSYERDKRKRDEG